MAFGWRRLDREDRSRGRQQALALGRPGPAVTFAVVAVLLGVPTVVLGLRGRRRDRGSGDA